MKMTTFPVFTITVNFVYRVYKPDGTLTAERKTVEEATAAAFSELHEWWVDNGCEELRDNYIAEIERIINYYKGIKLDGNDITYTFRQGERGPNMPPKEPSQ